nr:MAG TPA: hypothetical protein [Caudoviricetes sp.]
MKMLNKLILFLIRKKLHLKKFQQFYFSNQAIKIEKYYFDNYGIMKISVCGLVKSNLSLNFLLSDECRILIRR